MERLFGVRHRKVPPGFTRPNGLTDEIIASTLAAGWGVNVEASEYLAIGFGSHHWAIRTPEGDRWFLTVDDLEANRHSPGEPLTEASGRLNAALRTARRLRDGGLEFVIAPVATSVGAVLAPIGAQFEAALYPWIEGRTHSYGGYTSESDRREVAALLGALHSLDVIKVPEARRDDFAIPNREDLMRAIDEVGRPWASGPVRGTLTPAVARTGWRDRVAPATLRRARRRRSRRGRPRRDHAR